MSANSLKIEVDYTHSNGDVERVSVVTQHSDSEGGGFTIYIPSLGRERQTVAERISEPPAVDFEHYKNEGNSLLCAGDLEGAAVLYTSAYQAACDEGNARGAAVAMSNRSLANLRMGNADQALADALMCKHADPTYAKAEFRIAQAEEMFVNDVE